jgi:hypothetical protein
VKSFLGSALKGLVPSGRGAITSRHDGAWLVWEPGSWKAPRAQTLVLGAEAVKDYRSVSQGTLKGAEALAIALPPRTASPWAAPPTPTSPSTTARSPACTWR